MPPNPPPLTKRQRAVLDALVAYRTREGRSPTMRELADATGLASTSTVHYVLGKLAVKGYIRRAYSTSRGIELLAPSLTGAHPSVEFAT